jgi:hypothetical protein
LLLKRWFCLIREQHWRAFNQVFCRLVPHVLESKSSFWCLGILRTKHPENSYASEDKSNQKMRKFPKLRLPEMIAQIHVDPDLELPQKGCISSNV